MNHHRIRADGALLMIAFVWGATFVLVQGAIEILPPFAFLTVRFGLAALLLWLYLLWQKDHRKAFQPRYLSAGIFLGLWLFVGFAFQTFSLLYTTSGKSGFLTGLSVALIPVFSFFISGIRPGINAWIGVGLAVAGLYLLALADFSQVNLGDILATICAVGFAFQVAYTAKYAPWAEAMPLVTVQVTFVAVASLILSVLFEPWSRLMTTQTWAQPGVWVAVWVTSLFATVLAYVGQTHFQRFTSPTRVALIFSMEPVFAALTDYWWLDTAITGWRLVGCALILTGMIIAELPSKFYQNQREGTTCEQKPSEY